MYDKLATLAPNHWMVYAKGLFIEPYLGSAPERKILDAGAGSGAMLSFLEDRGVVTAMDVSAYALKLAKDKGKIRKGALICGDVATMPLEGSSFDAVALLDVLYHRSVEDEDRVISECHRVLKPGGKLIVVDSAFKFLEASYDNEVHAARRYTTGDMKEKFLRRGFKIDKASYVFFSLFPFVLAIRIWRKFMSRGVKEADHIFSMNPIVNAMMRMVMRAEALILRVVNFPFGVSVLCVGTKGME